MVGIEELSTINEAAIVFDLDKPKQKESLIGVSAINRRNGSLFKPTNSKSLLPGSIAYNVVCIFGTLKLLAGQYLVVATSSKVVGDIFNEEVHNINSVTLIQISRRELEDKKEEQSEKEYISMIQKLLSDGSFYFSYGYDLTNSCQRKSSKEGHQGDLRFDWSHHMRESFIKLIKPEGAQDDAKIILKWCVPVIQGFVSITPKFTLGTIVFDYILISRKARERPGRRLITRGANKSGQVVNYVETEQIIATPTSVHGFPTDKSPNTEGPITSFVQIRGSIPLLWEQKPNLAWEPPIKIKPKPAEVQDSTLKNHFNTQLTYYNRQTVVSLIKLKGGESELGKHFTKYIEKDKNSNLNYIQFDLQSEVGHTKYQNLEKLFAQTNPNLESYGFFSMVYDRNDNRMVWSSQTGTMRTNCKDNLDRTNLVQSRFAIKAANKQLDLFIPNANTILNASEKESFERLIRIAWANNGDTLSLQYAGTRAIRSDHTRTGTLTLYGLLNDGINSVTRYYINNYEDGRNQDALDLVVSKRLPLNNYKTDPKHHTKTNRIMGILTTFFTVFFKTFQPSRESYFGVYLCFLWMSCVFFIWKIFRLDPNRIIDYPKLSQNKIPKETEQEPQGNAYKIIKKNV
jgi:hypothetical protein